MLFSVFFVTRYFNLFFFFIIWNSFLNSGDVVATCFFILRIFYFSLFQPSKLLPHIYLKFLLTTQSDINKHLDYTVKTLCYLPDFQVLHKPLPTNHSIFYFIYLCLILTTILLTISFIKTFSKVCISSNFDPSFNIYFLLHFYFYIIIILLFFLYVICMQN